MNAKAVSIISSIIASAGCIKNPTLPDYPTGHPLELNCTYRGYFLGRATSGTAIFHDMPAEGFENRFGFILDGAGPGIGVAISQWTWVRVAAENHGMRIRAEGLFDIWFDTKGDGGDAFEELWQLVNIKDSVVIIEEKKGNHISR